LVGIYTFIKDALRSHLKENDTIVLNKNFEWKFLQIKK